MNEKKNATDNPQNGSDGNMMSTNKINKMTSNTTGVHEEVNDRRKRRTGKSDPVKKKTRICRRGLSHSNGKFVRSRVGVVRLLLLSASSSGVVGNALLGVLLLLLVDGCSEREEKG